MTENSGVEPKHRERDAPANAALPSIDASPGTIAQAIFQRGAAPRSTPEPEEDTTEASSDSDQERPDAPAQTG